MIQFFLRIFLRVLASLELEECVVDEFWVILSTPVMNSVILEEVEELLSLLLKSTHDCNSALRVIRLFVEILGGGGGTNEGPLER